ncbi:MAG: glycosyltransferase, partial [Betaproteobacteria bacterium]
QIPQILLLICGEGPAQRALANLVHALGLQHHVRFVGYLDRATALLDCYRAADVFVFASRTETQGLVLLEAMAVGVRVVSTAVMGTREIVGPGKGAVVSAENEQDFAAAVVRVLSDDALHARLSAQALQFAKTWSAPATAVRLDAAYQELVSRIPGSAREKPTIVRTGV